MDSLQPPSVVVLTRNEEINIEACLRSLAFSDDIVVLDSMSTDRTRELAAAFPNVRVVQRAFDIEYNQRNFSLHGIAYRHPWLYICDADERVGPELAREIMVTINNPALTHVAYRLRFKNMYGGRWIKRVSGYPVWIMRLVQPARVRYEERQTNIHPLVDGTIGRLRQHFIHYSFNKGLVSWFEKHNFYSQKEALEATRVLRGSVWKELHGTLSGDASLRRRAFKNLSFFLPGRDFLRFFHLYVLRRGFLDGAAGFHYAAMVGMYEYWIELKVQEQLYPWRQQTDRLLGRLLTDDQPPNKPPAAPSPSTPPLVEVMIPTFNEADHVTEAVANARALGPVFVLDSFSTDGTQELARQAGATVVEHAFVDYSSQKNWGLDHLPFRGRWVFILDADERIPPALLREIVAKLAAEPPVEGYYINRLLLCMGRPVRHGGLYPAWNLRLFRRGAARYESRAVHEHMICPGRVAYMRGEMLHIRRESISHYLDKHIRYADLESDEWLKFRLGRGGSAKAGDLFSDALRYRQWFRRRVWPHLPGRPLWRFLYMYFVEMGFLDGAPGWHLARLMACYESMIGLLYSDKLRQARQQAPPEIPPSTPASPAR